MAQPSTPPEAPSMESDQAVRNRYAAAARAREAALCCPVDYPSHYLKAIPAEVIPSCLR